MAEREQPERFGKEHRRAERARIMRLSRLPGPFQTFAARGRGSAALVTVFEWTLCIVVALAALRLLTGSWLPRYASVVVVALVVALQSINRSVNVRAERRASP